MLCLRLLILTAIAMLWAVAGPLAVTACAQVPSDVDTLRVSIAPILERSQIVDVDISVRYTDTLGAFAFRLRYDTLVFEPVQDTFLLGGDTVVGIIAFDLNPGHFEQFAGSVRSPGEITFLAADMDLDTASLVLPGSYAAVRMKWRIHHNASIGPTFIYFENDSVLPSTWNAFSDWWGDDFIRPVFTNASTDIACICDCFAESGSCDGNLDVIDVLATINVAFRGESPIEDPNQYCPRHRSDVDCDGVTGILDVIRIIEVAFRGADPTSSFCQPCQ